MVWDIIFQNRVDRDGVPWDGDSDSDFSSTTSLLSDLGTSVIFAAVSSESPTGDNISMVGATMPLFHIEGNQDAIIGEDHAALPFPGIRDRGSYGSVDAPRGAGGIVRRLPMVIRMGELYFPALSFQTLI